MRTLLALAILVGGIWVLAPGLPGEMLASLGLGPGRDVLRLPAVSPTAVPVAAVDTGGVRTAPAPNEVRSAAVAEATRPAALAAVASPTSASRAPATQPVIAKPTPALASLPWVRTVRETPFLAGGAAPAPPAAGTFAAGTHLRPLGPVVQGHLPVYFPGDWTTYEAWRAWVPVEAVTASPPPAWLAAVPPGQGAGSHAGGPPAPRRVSEEPPPTVTAKYIAVIDGASGELLYGLEPHRRVPPASTTKIATTLVALQRAADLQHKILASVSATEMVARDGSSAMGLEPGELLPLETYLYGMMLPSGNDAAEQVALTLGDGSPARYLAWMNQEVAALGLSNTHFVNPSGMDADGHYSSAYDMALLARYAMRHPKFRELAVSPSRMMNEYWLPQYNPLIGSYEGADGVKIGFTDAARRTMVASATRNGHRVYVSLMRSENLLGDSTKLLDWVWKSHHW